jgi:4-amino-4-deoxy-L-arabinose transferase-like glycosyltransferase
MTILKNFFLKYGLLICAIAAFAIPLIIYILTLEPKLVGGDTSWFAIYVPRMEVLVPTGYPSFSIFGKLATLLPVKDIAYRLNLMSAIFGALAVLFLFLAINKITKNVIISLAAALSFGFAISFWQIANRFEMDSINCFYLALLLYAAFLYAEKKDRPRLYFAAACMGFFLTDHPIAMFILPSILIYVILVKPAVFKNAKAVLLGILFFILPLSMYAFIPIRSAAGFGQVKTLKDFFYWITGRYTNGAVHGGSFGDKDWPNFLKVSGEFFQIIYKNFGPVLIILAIAGLVYLFKKNYRLAVCFVLLVISNLLIMSQFIGWAAENHVLDTMIIMTVLIGLGFMLVFDMLNLLINKIASYRNNSSKLNTVKTDYMFKTGQKINESSDGGYKSSALHESSASFKNSGASILEAEKNSTKVEIVTTSNENKSLRLVAAKNIILAVFLAATLVFPVLLATGNYKSADWSKPQEIYLFWDNIFKTAETGSSIYVASVSSNIGEYISIYEQQDKNISYITNKSPNYTAENIIKDLEASKQVYLVGIEDFLIPRFNLEKINEYRWPRFSENIIVYRITGQKLQLEITPALNGQITVPDTPSIIKFGQTFTLEYKITNNYNQDIKVTSLELALPKNIKFVETDKSGITASTGSDMTASTAPNSANITDDPGISRGKYMWVKEYIVKPGASLTLKIKLKAQSPGDTIIKFSVTSQDFYMESPDVQLSIAKN